MRNFGREHRRYRGEARAFQRYAWNYVRETEKITIPQPLTEAHRAPAGRLIRAICDASWLIAENPLPNPRRKEQLARLEELADAIADRLP